MIHDFGPKSQRGGAVLAVFSGKRGFFPGERIDIFSRRTYNKVECLPCYYGAGANMILLEVRT